MRKIMLFMIYLFVIAGAASFFVDYLADYIKPKKEIKKSIHNHASDLPHVVNHKKIDTEVYFDDEAPLVHKISNTEIANLIKWTLPLNPWLKNQDSVYYGKDTITWNYIAMGLGKINPRYAVSKNHPMWLTAREILQYNRYLWYQPSPSELDPESVDLTKKELDQQKTLDKIRDSDEEIICLGYILLIGIMLLLICGARIIYLIEHSD